MRRRPRRAGSGDALQHDSEAQSSTHGPHGSPPCAVWASKMCGATNTLSELGLHRGAVHAGGMQAAPDAVMHTVPGRRGGDHDVQRGDGEAVDQLPDVQLVDVLDERQAAQQRPQAREVPRRALQEDPGAAADQGPRAAGHQRHSHQRRRRVQIHGPAQEYRYARRLTHRRTMSPRQQRGMPARRRAPAPRRRRPAGMRAAPRASESVLHQKRVGHCCDNRMRAGRGGAGPAVPQHGAKGVQYQTSHPHSNAHRGRMRRINGCGCEHVRWQGAQTARMDEGGHALQRHVQARRQHEQAAEQAAQQLRAPPSVRQRASSHVASPRPQQHGARAAIRQVLQACAQHWSGRR